jgi:catechol 2,3-dioxygenase-like lactoylglutathione lyase family enzyme
MNDNNNDVSKSVTALPLSRRQLLAAMSAMGIAPAAFGQGAPAIRLRKINCFEVRVADVARTVAFYQDLFGMPVQARFGDRVCLRVGEGPAFMAVRRLLPGETPAITHLGYSVEDFDVSSQQAALNTLGYTTIEPPPLTAPGIANALRTWVRMRGDTPELYFADARGLIVQLSAEEYCGGSGPLGTVCGAPETAPAGMFGLHEINHFTAFVSDGAGANAYYQQTFGLAVQAYQGPNSPVTGIGDGHQFVMYAGGGPGGPGGAATPANIHHGCFNMHDFDVDAILAKLTDYGLTARGEQTIGPMMHYISLRQPERGGAEGGTPELYFTDPDGILMQLQDTSYCGGGGYLGNECLSG